MLLIQIILLVFVLFALSRVYLQFKNRQLKLGGFLFWALLFLTAIIGIILPNEMTRFANALGIGRGVDFVIYASIALLFYLVFRLYVYLEEVRHEITDVVRKIALQEDK